MNTPFLIKIIAILVIGLGIAAGVAAYQIQGEKNDRLMTLVEKPAESQEEEKDIRPVAKNFGGPFTLTNHLGEPATHRDFKNQYRLIYFGFTYCPAICPTELQRMTTVLKDLGKDGEAIQPLFITVDPERDTVPVMKDYVELFHPRLIGLTGTPAQIKEAKKSYKIYAAKVQTEEMTDYTMDHSSFIYFISPDDSLIRVFKMGDKTEDMTNLIRKYINK